uniref:Spore coat associated protein CotJA n=1 Tax=Ammonifex degensii TaxID=42838 RepID=A0A7C2IVP5_9THEO
MKKQPSPQNENAAVQSAGGSPCPELRLATAYVPPQGYGKQFSPEEALQKGTLWPDLYSPYPR